MTCRVTVTLRHIDGIAGSLQEAAPALVLRIVQLSRQQRIETRFLRARE